MKLLAITVFLIYLIGLSYQSTHYLVSNRAPASYCADEVNKVKCNRSHLQAWEKFTFDHISGNLYYIRGGNQNKYCHGSGGEFKCDSSSNNGNIYQWYVENHDNVGNKYFKNRQTNKYVVAEEQKKKVLWWWEHDYYYFKCNRDHPGPWEIIYQGQA